MSSAQCLKGPVRKVPEIPGWSSESPSCDQINRRTHPLKQNVYLNDVFPVLFLISFDIYLCRLQELVHWASIAPSPTNTAQQQGQHASSTGAKQRNIRTPGEGTCFDLGEWGKQIRTSHTLSLRKCLRTEPVMDAPLFIFRQPLTARPRRRGQQPFHSSASDRARQ